MVFNIVHSGLVAEEPFKILIVEVIKVVIFVRDIFVLKVLVDVLVISIVPLEFSCFWKQLGHEPKLRHHNRKGILDGIVVDFFHYK